MADISHTINLSVNTGTWSQNINTPQVTADFATAGMMAVTLNVGTATQQIVTSSASVLGLCMARSLGTTTISLGRLVGTAVHVAVRIKRNDAQIFRLAPVDYAVYGDGENGKVLLQILQE